MKTFMDRWIWSWWTKAREHTFPPKQELDVSSCSTKTKADWRFQSNEEADSSRRLRVVSHMSRASDLCGTSSVAVRIQNSPPPLAFVWHYINCIHLYKFLKILQTFSLSLTVGSERALAIVTTIKLIMPADEWGMVSVILSDDCHFPRTIRAQGNRYNVK